jgi:hypothetical protein
MRFPDVAPAKKSMVIELIPVVMVAPVPEYDQRLEMDPLIGGIEYETPN